jgi:hypothetical protein
MSVVTTLIIATSIMESEEDANGNDIYPQIDRLNELLGGGEWFKPVHDFAGGNKCPQAYAFMAAINHLDLDAFKAHMRNVAWEEPEVVLLLVNREEQAGFAPEEWR